MAGTLTVTGMSAGLAIGEKVLGPITSTGTTNIGTVQDIALATGDNTIAVPTGAVAALIVFPSGSTATLKVRTNLDTGSGMSVAPQSAALWAAFPLSSGVTSLIINASAGSSLISEVTFI